MPADFQDGLAALVPEENRAVAGLSLVARAGRGPDLVQQEGFIAETEIERIGLEARMGDLAVNNFNLGIRAYYFGLAALAWFVQPWMFIVASAWVVLVLWRREFKSRTLAALEQ